MSQANVPSFSAPETASKGPLPSDLPMTPKKYKLVWILCLVAMLLGVGLVISGLMASPIASRQVAGGVGLAALGFVIGWVNRAVLWWRHR